MNIYQFLELVSTVFSLFYLIFLIKEKKVCWIFGILASSLSIIILAHSTLYAEAILALYYVVIGFYGWWHWNKKNPDEIKIQTWGIINHVWAISIGIVLSLVLAYTLSKFTNSKNPFADSFITIFSFIASYKEAKKVLSGWIYWFFINGFSVGLYFQRSLNYYAFLAIIYTLMTVWGYLDWYKKIATEKSSL
ncbi:MAG: hypothetical protein EAZ07_04945 [Cytophagales bacterium]|nr:MAG: hypothetical protein EAZ07_04945 [Cytophagales bacterium]